ncbi:BCHE [Cordylochernes scorpioides]|uniref:BCHE n=1 Tax=Cordylochernes scorpioides TaxID=51811 RepID=A0ABY6LC76_9ARAC|nr:BCHE [Cordylochernes scorpioides]
MASVVPPTVRLPETETLITGSQQTVSGKLLDVYLSIPYAQPPTGERRFKDPEPITNLPPQINATQFPPSCCQINFEPLDHVNKIMSEDCLYLNIWTPSQKSHMSVLIFIYGGSFEFGSTDELMNNPQYLAARTDMVIVTMNYRVGAFGFIDLKIEGADGNLGLKDQILAFKWVKKNIRAFGGNPDSRPGPLWPEYIQGSSIPPYKETLRVYCPILTFWKITTLAHPPELLHFL